MTHEERDPRSWGLSEGDAITAELTAMRRLGGGAAYEAFLAFDRVTYGPVVVKVLRPSRLDDDSGPRGLRREVDALQRANHPVVVRWLRHDVEGPRPHLVMEHVDGPRLSSLVRRYGPLEEQQYLPLVVDVATALHFFRERGLVHLDIKPSNVIMGSPARLIDFSLARPVEEAATVGAGIGTDRYMAPEQCDPGGPWGVPDPASDVWGLGAILHESITGERPFPDGDPDADDPAERHPQLVSPAADLTGRAAPEVVEVARAALDRRPEGRPEPAEVVEALGAVLERLPRSRLAGFRVRG